MISTKSALVLLSLFGCSLWSASARAEAAVAPGCRLGPGYLQGGSVPANAPAIPVFDASTGGVVTLTSAKVGDVALSSELDPTSTGVFLLKASTSFAVNKAASLLISTTCSLSNNFSPPSFPIIIGPESPLPTSLGTATVNSSGSSAVISLTPEATSYLAVMRVTVSLGTEPLLVDPSYRMTYGVRTAPSGTLDIALGDGPSAVGQYGIDNATLFSKVCGSKSGTPTPFTLLLSAHIAGAPVDPPALPVAMVADCVTPTSNPAPQEPATTRADAGPDDSVVDADEGCSMAKGGANTDAWILGLAGIAIVLTGSRRRLRKN